MKEISRRDFLKVSSFAATACLLPEFKSEAQGELPPPMTDLPVFWTSEAPVQAVYLKRTDLSIFRGPWWNKVSSVPLDVMTPLRTVHHSQLEGYNLDAPYEYALVSSLPHITGSPAKWEAVVGWADRNGVRQLNGSLEGKGAGIISTYSYGEQRDLYPNKIWNVLLALERITDWMRKNGPLVPGRDYSMLEMSDLIADIEQKHLYRLGLTAVGGGVCSVSSTLSKAVFLASARGYTEEVARTMHTPFYRYWPSPLEPGITQENTDATLAYFNPDSKPFDPDNLDYIFRLKPNSPPLYLSAKVHLAHNPEPKYGDLTFSADAQMIFTLTLSTREISEDEGAEIAKLRERYAAFHGFHEEIVIR